MGYIINLPVEVTCHSIFSLFDEERTFKTSLNIIGEVLNVPMCALSSILRANGYDEVDPASICIDQKMLTYFADAYIRKMKNYFLSSIRNIEKLTYQELADLNEFYNTFKKQEDKYTGRAKWSHIDTGLLRDAFLDKVKELTPRRKSRYEYFLEQMFGKCEYSNLHFNYDCHEYKPETLESPNKDDFLFRISHNRFYLVRHKIKKVYCCSTNILRRFFIAARYHIFVADGKDADDVVVYLATYPTIIFNLSNKYEQKTTFKKYRDKQPFC